MSRGVEHRIESAPPRKESAVAVEFKREPVTVDLCREMLPLFSAHYQEIAHFKDIPLDPDFDQYIKLDEAGFVRAFTARTPEGEILGYAVFFVKYNPHYKTSLQASQDVLYIDKKRRGFGAKFILWCDRELAKEGIQLSYHHIKQAHDFGPMLKRMGYELVDYIYARRLDK